MVIATITTIITGMFLGGFLAVITTCPEAHDEELVCWGKCDQ